MENLLNPDGLFNLFSRMDPGYRHTCHALGEAQGREEYRLYHQYRGLIERIVSLSSLSQKSERKTRLEKTNSGETLVFDFPDVVEEEVKDIVSQLIPWRKGPYRLSSPSSSCPIDSEWDSSIKWNRLSPYIRDLIGDQSMVADLGTNNGYFLFRLLSELSEMSGSSEVSPTVVGFEPVHRNALQYLLLNSLVLHPQAFFLLLGYEALGYFPKSFDVILCLGILYHHPDPIGVLKLMAQALKPGGAVVIDCQGIPGEDPLALFPHRRYTGKRNFWFLPTVSALQCWLERAGFKQIQSWGEYPLGEEEQRSTSLAPGDSLAEGLADPETYYQDNRTATQTIEGYPAPIRIYLGAKI